MNEVGTVAEVKRRAHQSFAEVKRFKNLIAGGRFLTLQRGRRGREGWGEGGEEKRGGRKEG